VSHPKLKVVSMHKSCLYVILLAFVVFLRAANAQELVISTEAGPKVYQLSELKSQFEIKTIRTISTWTDDETVAYKGISLKVLLDEHKLSGTQIEISAENGYVSKIPKDMIETFDPIVAFEANGRPLDFSNRGPLSVIWPRSDHPVVLGETIDGMWTWYASEIRAFD